jgi:hypothetical protein
MLSPDAHVWACALKVVQDHGDQAPVFVSKRIGALALNGDWSGVDMWKAIAEKLDQLDNAPSV